jgi:hypothetical protein
MNAISVELRLPPQQYEQLTVVAQARQLPVAEVAQAVVTEWLEHQAQLEHARMLMRELGQGLGEGHPIHDAARHHDDYLYTVERA